MAWKCPKCERSFRQVNQRHACGTGDSSALLKNRPPELAALYRELAATIEEFGAVEVVTRDRYALFRTTRIFTDLTVTRDALRVVIHLGRKVSAPCFVKSGGDKRVSHVALVRTGESLHARSSHSCSKLSCSPKLRRKDRNSAGASPFVISRWRRGQRNNSQSIRGLSNFRSCLGRTHAVDGTPTFDAASPKMLGLNRNPSHPVR